MNNCPLPQGAPPNNHREKVRTPSIIGRCWSIPIKLCAIESMSIYVCAIFGPFSESQNYHPTLLNFDQYWWAWSPDKVYFFCPTLQKDFDRQCRSRQICHIANNWSLDDGITHCIVLVIDHDVTGHSNDITTPFSPYRSSFLHSRHKHHVLQQKGHIEWWSLRDYTGF